MATCAALITSPTAGTRRAGHAAGRAQASPDTIPSGYGYVPSQLQSAYGLPSTSAGSGQTVAIVSAYDDPDAASDLAAYRTDAGLPPCGTGTGITGSACFQKVNQTGGTSYPGPGAGWSADDAESMDIISAVCPNCHILLVEATGDDVADLGTADSEAATLGAKFIDNDWFTSESGLGGKTAEQADDSAYFDHPGVAITAPSGNSGFSGGVNYPAASQYVIAVGGTTLAFSTTGVRGWTETAFSGSGSGCSAYEPKPSWQTDTACSDRTLDDLAAVADPADPIAVYDTPTFGGWGSASGTAASSALVAAAYALAGTPAANTSPASYPYENPGGS
jgi:subtilase family serine protease